MKGYTISKYLFLLLIPVILFSCKKSVKLEVCKSNCKTYVLRGHIYDATVNKGFGYSLFRIRMESFIGNCIFCPRALDDIYVGITDGNGDFAISVKVDSTLFNDYSMKMFTPDRKNYYKAFNEYVANSSLNYGNIILVPFYREANLTVKLFRMQNDTFNTLRISHQWEKINNDGRRVFGDDYWGSKPVGNEDTIFHLVTAADILTKVTVTKSVKYGSFTDIKDSIVCRQGENNVLNIDY